MNMMALTWGETTIVVDAGVMFPEPELLGVDRIIPDLTYLQQKGRAAALVLTHGHEDHIGGVPHVLPLRRRPGLRHAAHAGAGRAEARRARHRRRATLRRRAAARPRHGRPVRRSSSSASRTACPDCVALAIHTPVGVIVHTGDFKIDQTPLDGEHFDLHRFAELGAAGRAGAVRRQHQHRSPRLHRLGDATSSTRSRRSSPAPPGQIVVAAFSSSIYRMQILVDLAAQFDRKVAFVGRGMIQNSADRAAARLPAHPGRRADPRLRRRQLSGRRTCCACRTGSQGEPMSALSRIAIDDHRHVKLGAGRHRRALGARRFPATRRRSAA